MSDRPARSPDTRLRSAGARGLGPARGYTNLDRLYRLSVDQYLAMAEAGILEESNCYHLIDGLLVYKMTKHAPHDIATDLLTLILPRIVPEGWFASMQNPILIREARSMPSRTARSSGATPGIILGSVGSRRPTWGWSSKWPTRRSARTRRS